MTKRITVVQGILWMLIGIAVLLRFFSLGSIPGINGDEAWLGWKAFQVAHGARLDWMTFSGNITDPFYILPLIGLHKLFAPSPFLLRSVALLSGILVLPVNFFFCQWVFNKRAAWASTLLMAVLPVNIVYSRFGWEPSQSVLFALPPLYLALGLGGGLLRPLQGIFLFSVALAGAFLVHPTNFFLAGFGIAAFAAALLHPEVSMKRLGSYAVVSAIGFLGLGIMAVMKAPEGVHGEILARLATMGWIHDADRFLLAWLRFFNGLNSFASIPGSWHQAYSILASGTRPWMGWPDGIALGCFLFAFAGLISGIFRAIPRGLSEAPQADSCVRLDIILLTGMLGSLLLFHLLNGPGKMALYFDRYGLWMVPSGILTLVRGAMRWEELQPKLRPLIKFAAVILCVGLLAASWICYFDFFLKTGGKSEMNVRVGVEDVKLSAARLLGSYGSQSGVVSPVLVSSDWFAYWPILYFLRSQPGWKNWISVREDLFPHYTDQKGWDLFKEVQARRVVFAEYSGSWAWNIWDRLISDSGIKYRTHEFPDITGRPMLLIKIPEVNEPESGNKSSK